VKRSVLVIVLAVSTRCYGAPDAALARDTTTTTATSTTDPCITFPSGKGTAWEILERRKILEDTTRHWGDRHQRMRMRVVDGLGNARTTELEMWEKRYPGDERRTLVLVRAPADKQGTAFLVWVARGKPAEQWLYQPGNHRTRRVTANIGDEGFEGADLTFHDIDLLQEMQSWSEADASTRLRSAESVADTPTYVIELTPRRDDVRYDRFILWLGRCDLVPRKIEFYGDKGRLRKRLLQSDVRMVGSIPVPYRGEVETPDAGTRTAITIGDLEFDRGMNDVVFSPDRLGVAGR